MSKVEKTVKRSIAILPTQLEERGSNCLITGLEEATVLDKIDGKL